METFAYFENIPFEIGRHLGTASAEIVVAVAWFTDPELCDLLCRQAGRGIRVSVAVLHDEINSGAGRLNFARLSDIGGKVDRILPGAGKRSIMHHKFCVIDRATVILGSRNWTKQAQSNDENITIVASTVTLARSGLRVSRPLSISASTALAAPDPTAALTCSDRLAAVSRSGSRLSGSYLGQCWASSFTTAREPVALA
jgi:hypothetical protein